MKNIYRVDQKKQDLEPETSLKGLMLRKLLDQSTFAYWALLGLTRPYWALLGYLLNLCTH